MVKPREVEVFQFCLLETYVDEVLTLPKEINIEELCFRVFFSVKKTHTSVPADLAELGVTSMNEPNTKMEVRGKLGGSRASIKRNLTAICEKLGLDARHAYIERMAVSTPKGDARFTRMTKKLPGGKKGEPTRTPVLGLVGDSMDKANVEIMKLVGAKKVLCKFHVEQVRTMTCST